MTRRSRLLGERGERIAEAHLIDRGLVILDRGYRCRLGELDLVAVDGEELVVVEVRYRGRTDFGTPLETITQHKQQRILRATRHYLMRHTHRAAMPLRFDVVGIDATDPAAPRLTWVRGAFGGA